MPSRTCSCLVVEYSKELRMQRLQSRRQIQEKLACIRKTCPPLGKVSASCVDHSGYNIAGQYFRSRAIPAGRVERNDESTGL